MNIRLLNIEVICNEETLTNGIDTESVYSVFRFEGYKVKFTLNNLIECSIFIGADKEMELEEIKKYISRVIQEKSCN
ncbi:hypothetical protein CBE01nite_34440 [Clostridium beijerinckii]|uniref:Uncharacterized protein n=1 Tax=Clostridium beijerinckii TaxID=1520 RepID=A0AB74VFP9_CLOBE|nr:hypothetical protein [Clostridium beijerinckii]NRZ24357.1 hypothetical protein [Clostridium beijerinckii]NYB99424.1 hypothetical protein [Clostridium beijerinckii]OOM21569.1 hypothetical protein CLBEI_37020 [Clostridium beijerinckii]QUN35194.1 hypothetical protein KEC93_25405 [Clostridium beijerinckii]SQB20271.1 Uncharacterised protein [Clostridium beijerinckii]